MDELPPILLIDKPKGITSFDVIRQLRRKTGIKKFGHAGTLDPLATGLMLIGVNEGTKRLTELVGLDKEYVAEILVGESRSTGDMEGVMVEERAYEGGLTESEIVEVLSGMVGSLELAVSAYSAIKKDGIPMYKRARKAALVGEVVADVPVRTMRVLRVELLAFKPCPYSTVNSTIGSERLLVTVRFLVGSGTYVRSLAEELGRRLGYPATLYNLRRTRVGEYCVEDAKELATFGSADA